MHGSRLTGRRSLLDDQDRALRDDGQIGAGKAALERALVLRRSGPYQLQAAIAALHTEPVKAWCQIAALYGELARQVQSPVVELNRAVAVAMRDGPARGLELMDGVPLDGYHLYHAARADLLCRLDRAGSAEDAYRRALELTRSESERSFLEQRLAEVAGR